MDRIKYDPDRSDDFSQHSHRQSRRRSKSRSHNRETIQNNPRSRSNSYDKSSVRSAKYDDRKHRETRPRSREGHMRLNSQSDRRPRRRSRSRSRNRISRPTRSPQRSKQFDRDRRHRRRSRSGSRDRSGRIPRTPAWTPLITGEYDPLKAGSIDGTDVVPHDHAVVRAMNSKYRPNKGAQGMDPQRSLFIGRLPLDADEADIRQAVEDLLSPHSSSSSIGGGGNGTIITQCRLVRDLVTGTSRRYAFLELTDVEGVRALVRRGDALEVNRSAAIVEPNMGGTLPSWIPRRLGGGLGGWKESGQLRFGGRARPFRKPILTQQ